MRFTLIPINSGRNLQKAVRFGVLNPESRVIMDPESDNHPQRLPEVNRILGKKPVSDRAVQEFEISRQRKEMAAVRKTPTEAKRVFHSLESHRWLRLSINIKLFIFIHRITAAIEAVDR